MGDINIIITITVETLSTITRPDIYAIFALIKETVIAGTDHFRTVIIYKIRKIFLVGSTRFKRKIFISHKGPWTKK